MSTYAIGDIQGCYQELLDLLDLLNFDNNRDQLWFTGDLVNRGPLSLEVLRFVKSLGDSAITVLGNHDLHLLAIAHNKRKQHKKDTIDKILHAPDCDELIDWITNLPFIHRNTDFCLIHAGLAPQWDMIQSEELAHEVENILRGEQLNTFLENMYGDIPDHWEDDLENWDRLRVITNAFTRLRYLDKHGVFALNEKGPPGTQTKPFKPWFSIPGRKTAHQKIIFGHWSTVYLGDIKNFREFNVFPMDTGCLWGGTLSALRLDDEKWFSVPSQQPRMFENGQSE